jgi:branched-chain amino acid transport system permease protein
MLGAFAVLTVTRAGLSIWIAIVSYLSTPVLGQGALLMVAIVLVRLMPQGISGRWGRQL